MATETIISDVGAIYKRLFNHRPVLQNEVHFFLQEFEDKRDDNDIKLLKDIMKLANEMDAVYLEEMKQSLPVFTQLKTKLSDVIDKCDTVIQNKRDNVDVSQDEKEAMTQEVEELKIKLAEEKQTFDDEINVKIAALKAESDLHRSQRNRLRGSRPGSASSQDKI